MGEKSSAKKGGKQGGKMMSRVWLLISLAVAIGLWTLLSVLPQTARSFPNIIVTLGQIPVVIERGILWKDLSSSLISVGAGYALGFIIALPVAILMAWYKPVRNIIEPWIQFIRNIPPLAYVPLIVIAAGVGRRPQIIVITIATFLIMCITMYQGIINIDETLIKAARVRLAMESVRRSSPEAVRSKRRLRHLVKGATEGLSAADCSSIRALSSRASRLAVRSMEPVMGFSEVNLTKSASKGS